MHYTQNEKLLQVGEKLLIIGIDIGSKKHYARNLIPRTLGQTDLKLSESNRNAPGILFIT